ncbi:hypothetical protein LTLLF_156720 [Microtus ochrogaster]|uniref:Uncharacterized protein n=1 Tax=Microtus ochrogaster TaxID=79684 RepID=A0A8J6GFI8_MICOH|nr:hypothetical protein LTLLF_156720 [Microtus ochrogaster]
MARGNILNFSHHQKFINDFSKHYVLPIQPITLRTCDKELAAVCTETTVCHGKQAWSRVSKSKIFICKWTAVNASDSSTISINKIYTLNHEILYDPMEGASFVPNWNTIFPKLSSAELPKALRRLRHHVCKQLDLHATNFLATKADIKEDHWINWT